MLYAKSMYGGGKFISADQVNSLDYKSYKRLGLRCIECGEEVYLKNGDNKKPHFAHFKKLENSSHNCPFRMTLYGLNSWRDFTPEGKNQRRKLFQQYFLNIIDFSYKDFLDKTDKINADFDPNLNPIAEAFKEKSKIMIVEIKAINTNILTEEKKLQKLIVAETIEYLSLPYTTNLLLKVLHYVLSNKTSITNEKYFPIFLNSVLNFLLEVDWLFHFDSYENKQQRKAIFNQNTINNKNQQLEYKLILKKEISAYIKKGISKFSKEIESPLFEKTFNKFKFSIEPNLDICLCQEYFRSRKEKAITKKTVLICKIVEFSIKKNTHQTIITLRWKFDYNFEQKRIIDNSIFRYKDLFLLKSNIENFITNIFIPRIKIIFDFVESDFLKTNRLIFEEKQRFLEEENIRIQAFLEIEKKKKEEKLLYTREIDHKRYIERENISKVFKEIYTQKVLTNSLDQNNSSLKISSNEIEKWVSLLTEEIPSELQLHQAIITISCPCCSRNVNLNSLKHFKHCFNTLKKEVK